MIKLNMATKLTSLSGRGQDERQEPKLTKLEIPRTEFKSAAIGT